MSVVYVRLAERPDLASVMWSMPNPWPAYMNQDPVADVFFLRLHEVFPEHQLLALDERGAVVGKANSLRSRGPVLMTTSPRAAGTPSWSGDSPTMPAARRSPPCPCSKPAWWPSAAAAGSIRSCSPRSD